MSIPVQTSYNQSTAISKAHQFTDLPFPSLLRAQSVQQSDFLSESDFHILIDVLENDYSTVPVFKWVSRAINIDSPRTYVPVLRHNAITKRVFIMAQSVRDQLIAFVDQSIMATSNQQLRDPAFLNNLTKEAGLSFNDRHVSKETEGLLLMAVVSEYLHRYEIRGLDGEEFYSLNRFQVLYPEICSTAKVHHINIQTLITVEKVFHVACKILGINPDRKKSALLVAANLIADPSKAMTTGSRQVVRTTLALELFAKVTNVKVVTRQRPKKQLVESTLDEVAVQRKKLRESFDSVDSLLSFSDTDSSASSFSWSTTDEWQMF